MRISKNLKNILLISSLFLLNACVSTGSTYSSSPSISSSSTAPTSAFEKNNQNNSNNSNNSMTSTIIDRIYEHRNEIDAAAQEAGNMLKKGGNLLGQTLEKAGELLQDATKP